MFNEHLFWIYESGLNATSYEIMEKSKKIVLRLWGNRIIE
jgi:hypothetical protein